MALGLLAQTAMPFALTMLGVVLLSFAAGTQTTTTVSDPVADRVTEPAGPRDDVMDVPRHPPYSEHAGEVAVDVYGNKVSRAVADYRVDHLGKMYERHEPQTLVIRLAPPGT